MHGAPWCYQPGGAIGAAATPDEQCHQEDAEKAECGWMGIGKGDCEGRGCCWDESRVGAPWCFAKKQAGGQDVGAPDQGQCAQVRESERRDCGFLGVTKEACEGRRCCWMASHSGGPWCFHAPAAPPPLADPQPPRQNSSHEAQKPDSPSASEGFSLPAASPKGSSMAFVHLFEWRWDDVARECEDFLGPKGFTAVQVSPPNEHIQEEAWWARYQPVSYKLSSRSGDEAAFASMVKRCNAAGVGIYVDAVINHMASSRRTGTGVGGSHYGKRSFPQFSPRDFHHLPGDEQRNCGVHNYGDKHEVQYCDLVGLADLRTGSSYVQEQIAGYINRMADFGVAGFRVDAAKHIDAGELGSIMRRVDSRLFRYLEVIGHEGEAVLPKEYLHLGHVTEFKLAEGLPDVFRRDGALAKLEQLEKTFGLMPSGNAVTFVDNHDTQRGHAGEAVLTHKRGALYTLATIFMLAHPYGYPMVMSSYHFDNSNQGPPHEQVHTASGVNCGEGKPWACEHRQPAIANMVGWRKSAGEGGIQDHFTLEGSVVGFCRGGRACVVINLGDSESEEVVGKLPIPPGKYCNVIKSDDPATCEHVSVSEEWNHVGFTVPPMSAVAFHVGVKAL